MNHKGKSRHFTNPDELERERKKELEEQRTKWRNKKEDDDESSEEEEAKPTPVPEVANKSADDEESGSDSEESDEEDDGSKKKKGVEGLIEIENPNRIIRKPKKLSALSKDEVAASGAAGGGEGGEGGVASGSSKVSFAPSAKPELSRREREELDRQRAKAHYQKLHAEGKTEEAQADLARLALVRKQREEAARKREEEKKAKESASIAKKEQTGKALGR